MIFLFDLLLQHPFIKKARPVSMLSPMLLDAARIREESEEAGDSEEDSADGPESELVSFFYLRYKILHMKYEISIINKP